MSLHTTIGFDPISVVQSAVNAGLIFRPSPEPIKRKYRRSSQEEIDAAKRKREWMRQHRLSFKRAGLTSHGKPFTKRRPNTDYSMMTPEQKFQHQRRMSCDCMRRLRAKRKQEAAENK
jgi:hypothetical protein